MDGRSRARFCAALLSGGFALGCAAAHAQEEDPTSRFSLEGQARVRYESLDGQFRAGGSGGDQAIATQILAHARYDAGPVTFGLELQDSRTFFDDAGTPLTTSIVNPADILQAYARLEIDVGPWFEDATLTIGRQTLGIGSRRVLERVEFANVIFSYTGAYWRSVTPRGDELHVVLAVPTERYPRGRTDLGENAASGDEEAWNRRLWGMHWRRPNALGEAVDGVWGEVFVYGLQETDAPSLQTPNRDYVQPGLRLFRAPRAGQWDFDLEASWRFGSRRLTAAAADTRDLEVNANTVHAHLGYTFDHPWRVRLAADYDFASGDDNPNDGRFDQYERLFGSRRTDLGNTGVFGPLTPANLDAPGARIEVAPSPRWDARIAYKAAFLASSTDAWVMAGVRDPTGRSGRFIGHIVDARTRLWLVPERLRMEAGGSFIEAARFARRAPNASGQGDSRFAYAQLIWSF